MVRSAKAAPVNGTKLSSGLLPQYRRTLGSERHRDEVVRPDELGTVPMAYGGINTSSLCFHLLMVSQSPPPDWLGWKLRRFRCVQMFLYYINNKNCNCNSNIVLYKFGIINGVIGQGLKKVKWYSNSILLTLQVSILARIMTGD